MARVKCPHCFHVNPDQQERCQKCDTPLPRIRIEARSIINEAAAPEVNKGPQLRRGQVVAGRYTVLNLVGQGGMGCIYKVHDNTLGEDVALKTLLPQFLNDKLVLERFYNEAKIARKLAHQNIVRVHDIGEDGKVLYISMEFLQGMSLREVLDNLKPGERLPIAQTLRIFDELCGALEYAHQFTIHRDIKPENVMLGQDGLVRLMDFGISKLMSGVQLTGASVVMGTPFYMSPEQIRNSRDVDARSDVYSVGVMLYEILTGNLPTGVPKLASEIISDVPPAMDKIVVKCVDPDPKARYQNASELRHALLTVRDMVKSGLTVPKKAATTQEDRPYSMIKVGGAIASLIVVAIALWGLVGAEQYRKTRASEVPPPSSTSSGTTVSSDPTFEAYDRVREALRRQAAASTINTGAVNALEDGDRFWEEATRAADTGDEGRAVKQAARAFQCYLALLMIPDLPHNSDMVFVKPGPIAGQQGRFVDGFFMDRNEVTQGQYRDFVARNSEFDPAPQIYPGRDTEFDDYPISHVSCLEAMAFAAAQYSKLPTAEQWLRAAAYGSAADGTWPTGSDLSEDDEALYNLDVIHDSPLPAGEFQNDQSRFGCWDMVGNVSEWTRSSDDNQPTFGSLMTVCGRNFAEAFVQPRDSRREMSFEERSEFIGFRCVVEIPASPATARTYLE